jgi:hypothetical protein
VAESFGVGFTVKAAQGRRSPYGFLMGAMSVALAGFGGARFCGTGGEAALFFCNRFGIDEPLAVAWAAGLFLLCAGEAAETEQAADFGARRVHYDGGLLGGKPVGEIPRHDYITLAASLFRFNSTD